MRILAITNMYPSAEFPARGVFVKEQIRGLRSAGVDVEVLFVDRRREGGSVYYRLPSLVRKTVARFHPHAIHLMYGGVMADQVARYHYDRPLIVTFHGSDLLGENLSGWIRKAISRYGVHCSRRAAAVAQGVVVVARHLISALKGAVPRERIRVIPCGIDLEHFRPLDPQFCKRRLNWERDAFHVLFASSNGDPVKRPALARAAVANMTSTGRPAILHYLTGVPNEEVPVWLNASDALLLTSMHEGSPTVVKEALACGLPVVSVNVGDVAERIEGIEGCYLAKSEADDIASGLELIRRRRSRLDCRSRLKEISSACVAQSLKQLYGQIVRADGRADLFSPDTDDRNTTSQATNRATSFSTAF